MNALDYLILLVLAISTIAALMRGLISEVMSLVVWVMALWLSSVYSVQFSVLFLDGIEAPALRLGSAYVAVFLLVLIAGGIVTWMIRRLIAKTGLSSTDRLLGAIFGFLRGLAVLFFLVILAGFTPLTKQPLWRNSVLLPSVVPLTRLVAASLPTAVRELVQFPELATRPLESAEAPVESPESSDAARGDRPNADGSSGGVHNPPQPAQASARSNPSPK